MRTLASTAFAVALAAAASPLAAQTTAAATKVACPDTITVVSTQAGREMRFVVRGAIDGVALIASQVRTVQVRTDRGDRTGVDLVASTPAQLVVPQAMLRLVLEPVDAGSTIRIERSGRDEAGRTQRLHAQGPTVSLARAGGTALQIVADEVRLRRDP